MQFVNYNTIGEVILPLGQKHADNYQTDHSEICLCSEGSADMSPVAVGSEGKVTTVCSDERDCKSLMCGAHVTLSKETCLVASQLFSVNII